MFAFIPNWQTIYFVCRECDGGGQSPMIEGPKEHIVAGFIDLNLPIPIEICEICGKPMEQLEAERASKIQEAASERNLVTMREWGIR